MQQLNANDAFMLFTETPSTPNQIGSLGILDPSTAPSGSLGLEDFVEFLAARVHLAKAFRQRMVRVPFDLDHPWWVQDENFDLEYHVRHTSLPPPGDWRQLCTLAGRLHSLPLDLTRPPWEAYLIEGVNAVPGVPEGAVAILLRMHHTAIDGVGGMEVLSAVFQQSPDDPPPAEAEPWHPEAVPSPWELLARAGVTNATRPLRLARAVTKVVPRLVRLPGQVRSEEVRLPSLTVPSTRFNVRPSPHRVFDSRVFPLEELKAIKSAVPGATVNDVALTICAGALRAYLESKGELPEESLAAVVPMSLRTEGHGAEGNRIAQLFCSLHTDIADPRARLVAITETTTAAKGSQDALGAQALMQISSVLPGALLGFALRANALAGENLRGAGLLNTQISNVPGPPMPLYCAGAKLLRFYGLGPVITGAALIHIIMSYCGQVSFSFTSDREILSDPEVYAGCLEASFSELRSSTVGPAESTTGAPKARARTKAKKRSTARTV